MRKIVDSIFQHPAARALILIVLVIPLSVYVGSSPLRRGFLYYTGVFAPAFAAAAAAGLWTWSWKWFWLTLVGCGVLTLLIQVVLTYAGTPHEAHPHYPRNALLLQSSG